MSTTTTTRRLIDSAELREMFPASMSRSSFYKAIHQPGFPAPVELVPGGDYSWWSDEVEAHVETLRVQPGARRRKPARVADDHVRQRATRRTQPETDDRIRVRTVRKVAA